MTIIKQRPLFTGWKYAIWRQVLEQHYVDYSAMEEMSNGQVTIDNMGNNQFTSQGNIRGGAYVGVSSGYVSLGGAITTVK